MNIPTVLKVWGNQISAAKKGESVSFLSSKQGDNWEDIPLDLNGKPHDKKVKRKLRKLKKAGDIDLYWCPNLFSSRKRRKDKVIKGKYLYADLDEVNPKDIPEELKPTIAWSSSRGRYQALWELESFLSPNQLEEINRRLTYTIGADKGGWDLTQVLRIPGSYNYKYKHPQKGKLLWKDGPVYKLSDLKPHLKSLKSQKTSGDTQLSSFMQLLRKYKTKIPSKIYRLIQYPPKVGVRSQVLWRIEHELVRKRIPLDDIVKLIQLSPWNKYKGRSDEKKRIHSEVYKVYEEFTSQQEDSENSPEPISTDEENESSLVLKQVSEYESKTVEWLWYPYIPKGGVTILDGDPGIGKSFLSMKLGALLSKGESLPGDIVIGETGQRSPTNIVYFAAEDDPSVTLRPRFEGMKANLNNLYICEGTRSEDGETIYLIDLSEPDGIAQVDYVCRTLNPSMIILDPLSGFIGGANINKSNEIRPLLTNLTKLAQKHNIAVVVVRHLTKGSREKIIYRGTGSIDFIAVARSSLMVVEDPEDPTSKGMFHVKHNLSVKGPALGFSITEGKFKWKEAIDFDIDQALQPDSESKANKAKSEATSWLTNFLQPYKNGISAQAVLEEARQKGFSERTLRRVKGELNIESKKLKDGWVWKLPKNLRKSEGNKG